MKPAEINIAIVIGQLGAGGSERQIYECLKILKGNYKSITVYCLSSKTFPFSNEIEKLGIPVVVLAHTGANKFLRLFTFIRDVVLRNIHLIHSYGDIAGLFSCLSKVVINIPVLHSIRNHNENYGILMKFIRRYILAAADSISVNSVALQDQKRQIYWYVDFSTDAAG